MKLEAIAAPGAARIIFRRVFSFCRIPVTFVCSGSTLDIVRKTMKPITDTKIYAVTGFEDAI